MSMKIKTAKNVQQREDVTVGAGDADTAHPELQYEAPSLVYYGDVRDVTLGPTVGIGESGNELGRRNPP